MGEHETSPDTSEIRRSPEGPAVNECPIAKALIVLFCTETSARLLVSGRMPGQEKHHAGAFAGTDPARPWESSRQLRFGVFPVPKSEGLGAPSVCFLGRRARGHLPLDDPPKLPYMERDKCQNPGDLLRQPKYTGGAMLLSRLFCHAR